MSEDTTERMDRAKRIRQMREGQRASVDGTDGGEDTEVASNEPVEGSTEGTDDPTPSDEPSVDTDDPSIDRVNADDGSGHDPDEATAAAQRAAESAARVTGTVATDTPNADASTPPTQEPSDVELPDEESVQAAIADEVLDPEGADRSSTARAADQATSKREETVRVLEFTLGDEQYCLDIGHVEEIVKRESITRVPNTPDYVEGVVDLRGQITTVLDPKILLDLDQKGSESLLVVFDPDGFEDQGAIGWTVDEVRQVVPIAESEINESPVDQEYVEGVVDREDEDEFVIWTDPEMAIRLATLDDGENQGET